MAMDSFTCMECGFKCNARAKLKVHERIHEHLSIAKPKPICEGCKKSFASASNLKRHQKNCKHLCNVADACCKENDECTISDSAINLAGTCDGVCKLPVAKEVSQEGVPKDNCIQSTCNSVKGKDELQSFRDTVQSLLDLSKSAPMKYVPPFLINNKEAPAADIASKSQVIQNSVQHVSNKKANMLNTGKKRQKKASPSVVTKMPKPLCQSLPCSSSAETSEKPLEKQSSSTSPASQCAKSRTPGSKKVPRKNASSSKKKPVINNVDELSEASDSILGDKNMAVPRQQKKCLEATSKKSIDSSAEQQTEDETMLDVSDSTQTSSGHVLNDDNTKEISKQDGENKPVVIIVSSENSEEGDSMGTILVKPNTEIFGESDKTDTSVINQEVTKLIVAVAEKKQFVCSKCSRTFSRKYHLDRHQKLSSCSGVPPPIFPCELCNRIYSRKDNLREHLRQHTGEPLREKRHRCPFCNKAFHGRSLLDIHIRTHTGEKPFKCESCDKTFPSSGALTKHERVHTGEKPYECKECGMKFSLKGTLKRHSRVHTGIRPHKCEFCGKQFIQIGGLKAHMFYHTGENGFKCDECGKIFNRKARLQMHVLYVHEKHRPYECEICSKKFTRKEDLNRHNVLHTGEKPYKCPTCSKTFAIKPSLKLHLMTHTKEEPRSCHECGRAFIRKDCLLRHMRKRHRDLLDKIFVDIKDDKSSESALSSSRMLNEGDLCDNITELLGLLVEESTLTGFGWPDKPVDEVLEAVIRRCGHSPVSPDQYSYMDRMRENAKLLFTVVIDDNAVKTLLNNQTVDEVILHVLRLAKT